MRPVERLRLDPSPLLNRLADLHGAGESGQLVLALSLFAYRLPGDSCFLLLDLPPPRGSPLVAATAQSVATVCGCLGAYRVDWIDWGEKWSRSYVVPLPDQRNDCQLSLPPGVTLSHSLPIFQHLGFLNNVDLNLH